VLLVSLLADRQVADHLHQRRGQPPGQRGGAAATRSRSGGREPLDELLHAQLRQHARTLSPAWRSVKTTAAEPATGRANVAPFARIAATSTGRMVAAPPRHVDASAGHRSIVGAARKPTRGEAMRVPAGRARRSAPGPDALLFSALGGRAASRGEATRSVAGPVPAGPASLRSMEDSIAAPAFSGERCGSRRRPRVRA
jgi:hypothetical protein